MKYSQQIGVAAVLLMVAVCYMPWSYVASQQLTITGMDTGKAAFGRPGILNIFFGAIALFFFLFPKIWGKRTNVFIGALNLSWSIRNYILVTTCYFGDCPEKRLGIYLLLFTSVIIFIMTLVPKINLEKK